jgi:hypothetical protein
VTATRSKNFGRDKNKLSVKSQGTVSLKGEFDSEKAVNELQLTGFSQCASGPGRV